MHTRHYVRDDKISVLFLQRNMMEDPPKTHPSPKGHHYTIITSKTHRRVQSVIRHPPQHRLRILSFFLQYRENSLLRQKKKGEAATSSANELPYNEQQPSKSHKTTSHPVLSELINIAATEKIIATEINDQLALPGNSKTYIQPTIGLDISTFILYDPRLRDNKKLPKSSSLGSQLEYK